MKFLALTALLLSLSACAEFTPFHLAQEPEEAPASMLEHQPIPEAIMVKLQEDLEINEIQAAAISGNLAQETGNFRHLQQINGPSFGYSQWMGSRKSDFFQFADENGGRHSFEANYGFLVKEIHDEYDAMMSRLRQTDDLHRASSIFMREFLRPSPTHANLPRRISFAQRYLQEDFAGAGCKGSDYIKGDQIMPCALEDIDSGATEIADLGTPEEDHLMKNWIFDGLSSIFPRND